MNDDAIYIFHASRQWGDYIIGVVDSSVVSALETANKHPNSSPFRLSDLKRYTLVHPEAERGVHFYIEIDNTNYY